MRASGRSISGTDPHVPALAAAAKPVAIAVRDGLAGALGERLLGLYVMGSAVSGGFVDGVSDVDLVAITDRGVDELDLMTLAAVHDAVLARFPGWKDRLEVVYIGRSTLSSFRTTADQLVVISPGEAFHRAGPPSDWLQNWYLLRTTGVALAGPPAATLVPEISLDEYLAGVTTYLRYLATSVATDAGAPGLAYAVLSACRAARTMATRAPCSKEEGAAWVRARRADVADVIDEASATRLAGGRRGFEDKALRARARELVREIAAAATNGAPGAPRDA